MDDTANIIHAAPLSNSNYPSATDDLQRRHAENAVLARQVETMVNQLPDHRDIREKALLYAQQFALGQSEGMAPGQLMLVLRTARSLADQVASVGIDPSFVSRLERAATVAERRKAISPDAIEGMRLEAGSRGR